MFSDWDTHLVCVGFVPQDISPMANAAPNRHRGLTLRPPLNTCNHGRRPTIHRIGEGIHRRSGPTSRRSSTYHPYSIFYGRLRRSYRRRGSSIILYQPYGWWWCCNSLPYPPLIIVKMGYASLISAQYRLWMLCQRVYIDIILIFWV